MDPPGPENSYSVGGADGRLVVLRPSEKFPVHGAVVAGRLVPEAVTGLVTAFVTAPHPSRTDERDEQPISASCLRLRDDRAGIRTQGLRTKSTRRPEDYSGSDLGCQRRGATRSYDVLYRAFFAHRHR